MLLGASYILHRLTSWLLPLLLLVVPRAPNSQQYFHHQIWCSNQQQPLPNLRTTPPTLHFRNLGSSSCKCIFNVHSMTRFGHNQASRCKTLKFTLRKSAPAFKAIAGSWPKCAESCWPGQLKHMKTNHAPRGCGTKCRDSCGPGNSPAALRKRVCFKPHASRASRTEPGIRWQQKPMALMHSSMVLHAIIISRAIHVDILDTLNVDTLWSRQDSEKTQRKDRIKYSNQIVKSKQLFP